MEKLGKIWHKERVYTMAGLVVALSISLYFFSVFSKYPLLPGFKAPLLYRSVIDTMVKGVVDFNSFGGFQVISSLTYILTGDLDFSLRFTVMVIILLFIYVVFIFASSVVGKKWIGIVAMLLVSASPAFCFILSDASYNLVFCSFVALFSLYSFFYEKISKYRFAGIFALCLLAPFSSLSCTLVILFSLLLFIAFKYKTKYRREALKLITVFVSCFSLFLLVYSSRGGVWGFCEEGLMSYFGGIFGLSLFALCVLLGAILLIIRRRDEVIKLVIVLSFTVLLMVFVDLSVVLLVLAMSMPIMLYPLSLVHEAFVVKRREEEVIEIEISLEKALAIALIVILACVNFYAGVVKFEDMLSPTPDQQVWLLDVIDWIRRNASNSGRIAAPPEVANWIYALTNREYYAFDSEIYRVLDSVTSTSFRIETKYLRVDEWEPLSAAKAPVIQAWSGDRCRGVVFIDDSKVLAEVGLRDGKRVFISPYRAALSEYEVSRYDDKVVLRETFVTMYLIINKTISVYVDEPVVEVRYIFQAISNSTINEVSLPVWSDYGTFVSDIRSDRNNVWMSVDVFDVSIKYLGLPYTINYTLKGHSHVLAVYRVRGLRAEVGVVIKVINAYRSDRDVWICSMLDVAREYGFNYVVIRNRTITHLEQSLVRKNEVLYIVDAFVRVVIDSWGNTWVEAPSYALVLTEWEERYDNGFRKFTVFRTAGLIINKSTVYTPSNVSVVYDVEPYKENTYLRYAMVSVWIPWERVLIRKDIDLSKGSVYLLFDVCAVNLSFFGDIVWIEVSPHPEYKQMRVLAKIRLEEARDRFGVVMKASSPLEVTYEATSRPAMETSDILRVFVRSGFIELVYGNEGYKVYKITP